MYIGEIATRCDVSLKTIRHYEAIGLLSDIKRQGSYRIYENADVEFVTLIKRAQLLGLSLTQLKQLIIGFKKPCLLNKHGFYNYRLPLLIIKLVFSK
ncbi:MerR family transcriptional regulator [Pseudoalteromonas prydzensis]|uniref:MerR family transcriptional regulator n=1 Tax=Pseudoalteromonas prydzensis TaxID=182141 RepID=UPI000AD3600E|nr:MerR family DNA-binding transcriptional regulator [Pseudoalteromonas prydzensis]MBE0379860.1 hypothetical protein [Pseudoalteromonas prydzensis ACAM 620]